MSNLKSFMNSDLGTFFNISEFAEYHVIDGENVLSVIDVDQFVERPREPVELYHLVGNSIFHSTITIYVKSTDYRKPVIGQRITVDQENYYVTSVLEDAGVLKITATANET
ncbi:hypothetical protein LR68_03863 [Anoxybacillus sp. BCO1]|nr:hypothetical protein LR68_03863 [Anoxybacillus sp. BCO1]